MLSFLTLVVPASCSWLPPWSSAWWAPLSAESEHLLGKRTQLFTSIGGQAPTAQQSHNGLRVVNLTAKGSEMCARVCVCLPSAVPWARNRVPPCRPFMSGRTFDICTEEKRFNSLKAMPSFYYHIWWIDFAMLHIDCEYFMQERGTWCLRGDACAEEMHYWCN